MTEGHPTVSAIALCYNHERFVIDCLESIKAQSYRPLQLIITDDSSSDSSRETIQSWITRNASLDITFLAHTENKGICRTLNEALAVSRGKYISMVATDDQWQSKKLE